MNKPCAFLDIETICGASFPVELARDTEPATYGALSPWLCEVVCVGVIWPDGVCETFGGEDGLKAMSEGQILRATNEALGGYGRCLVTFNGRGFDLAVLVNRMAANGITPNGFLVDCFREYRYRPEKHFDCLDLVTGFGAARRPSLREVCLGFGLADPKAGGCGADVAQLYRDGKHDDIARYCLGDVRATQAVWERVKWMVGR